MAQFSLLKIIICCMIIISNSYINYTDGLPTPLLPPYIYNSVYKNMYCEHLISCLSQVVSSKLNAGKAEKLPLFLTSAPKARWGYSILNIYCWEKHSFISIGNYHVTLNILKSYTYYIQESLDLTKYTNTVPLKRSTFFSHLRSDFSLLYSYISMFTTNFVTQWV